MSETKQSVEFKLNQLSARTVTVPQKFTNSVSMTGIPGYADKATAEAALAVGELYYITSTGVLMVATA